MTAASSPPGPPKRPDPTSRLLKAGGIVVAVVLVAELAARVLVPHLPPTSIGDAAEMQLKSQQLDQARAGAPADVVILGNSMADRGIDPAKMTAARPGLGQVYNAALVGAPLRGEASWANRFVLPDLHPKTVVLAMSPLDMFAIDPIATLTGRASGTAEIAAIDAQFTDSLDRLSPGPWQRIDDRLADTSALVANRASLRHPSDVGKAFGDLVTGKPKPTALERVGAQGGKLVPRDEVYWRASLTPEGHARELEERSIQGAPDERTKAVLRSVIATRRYQEAAFADLLDTVSGDGRRVVVAILPVATEWLDANGIGQAGLERATRAITAQAEAAGATVVDLTASAYPPALYTDLVHLNGAGADRFSADLAKALP